jgi:hypothetical protein
MAMSQYNIRLIEKSGLVRTEQKAVLGSLACVWRYIGVVAQTTGQPGDIVQVVDAQDQMIIRTGVNSLQAFARVTQQAA